MDGDYSLPSCWSFACHQGKKRQSSTDTVTVTLSDPQANAGGLAWYIPVAAVVGAIVLLLLILAIVALIYNSKQNNSDKQWEKY